jgi:hypothetical protein
MIWVDADAAPCEVKSRATASGASRGESRRVRTTDETECERRRAELRRTVKDAAIFHLHGRRELSMERIPDRRATSTLRLPIVPQP